MMKRRRSARDVCAHEVQDERAAWLALDAKEQGHETGETPISRFEKTGPHRQADPARLAARPLVTSSITAHEGEPRRAGLHRTRRTPGWARRGSR